jgi:hypothetical protein
MSVAFITAGTWVRGMKSQEEAVRTASCKQEENSMVFVFESSPFINVVEGVFFVVRVTLVPVSYLSSPSAVHSYRVPGKFIRNKRKIVWFLFLNEISTQLPFK